MSSVLRKTSNYEKFDPLPQNRKVVLNKKTVKLLTESMMKYGFISAFPLLVFHNGGSKLMIKSGHHRFEVARALGLPVWYTVCDNELTISEIEKATTPWTTRNFMESYVRAGNEEYQKAEAFSNKTGISSNMSAILLSGQKNTGTGTGQFTEKFRNGEFKSKDEPFANLVGDIVIHCKSLGVNFATATTFVSALSKAVQVKGFNPAVFKFKVKSHSSLMKRQAGMMEYVGLIEKVYNRCSSDILSIKIEVEKAERKKH